MQFRLLGPLEVADGDRTVELPPGKPRALLALLCLEGGRVVSVQAIVNALWGERPPPTAKKIVQGYVSRLRKLLPDGAVETCPPGYLLRVDAEQIDLRRFERLFRQARAAVLEGRHEVAASALREALALWR